MFQPVVNAADRPFLKVPMEYGLPLNPDFNGSIQEGAGIYQTTDRNGRRRATATGSLQTARTRAYLIVETRCLARSVLV